MKNISPFQYYELSEANSENLLIISGVINEENIIYPVGSGVIFAPYLALTAKHVINELWKNIHHHPFDERNKTQNGQFSIIGYQILNSSNTNQSWSVNKIWDCPGADIVLLELSVPPDIKGRNYTNWPKLSLNSLPPYPGEIVTGIGFGELDRNEETILCSAKKSEGEVLEVFGERRENGVFNFPCFSINANFAHGMSGGPIIDQKGHLRGIVSGSSIDEMPSYGASLWPIAGTKIHDINNQIYSRNPFPLFLDLMKSEYCDAINWENIEVREENGLRNVRIFDPNIPLQSNPIGTF
jgi:hypothetical protein